MEETLLYAAWLHFEGTDGVGVTFPDFPGYVNVGHRRVVAVGARNSASGSILSVRRSALRRAM